jgi:hypothetical protein
MVETNRDTGCFSERVEVKDCSFVNVIDEPDVSCIESNHLQSSFNDLAAKAKKVSIDPSPSPSPFQESNPRRPIVEELFSLEFQIKAINEKLSQNLLILREKQAKNQELKSLIEKHENKSTLPTDGSFIETKCTCNDSCRIL